MILQKIHWNMYTRIEGVAPWYSICLSRALGSTPCGGGGGEEREDRVEVCPQFLRDSACPLLGPGTLRQTVQVSVPAGPSFTSSIHVSNIKATEKTER